MTVSKRTVRVLYDGRKLKLSDFSMLRYNPQKSCVLFINDIEYGDVISITYCYDVLRTYDVLFEIKEKEPVSVSH